MGEPADQGPREEAEGRQLGRHHLRGERAPGRFEWVAEHGIQGAKPRGRPWLTTTPDPHAERRPDLVERDFSASEPGELVVADFTYVRC